MATKKPKSRVIPLLTKEAVLKRRLRRHLNKLGFKKDEDGNLQLPSEGKDTIRTLHQAQRKERLASQRNFLAQDYRRLQVHFADGIEIDPAAISPALERVRSGTWQADLFKLASLTWSVPVSPGFGRRMRYLVWDQSNRKLIGIFAIGDPVFNLAVRDNFIGWTGTRRRTALVNIMDAYVLGSVPPYNQLLGGKLIASMLRTRELYDQFTETYGNTKGLISNKRKRARLLAITTSSSMGRSSVYNRLKLGSLEYLQSIGYTGGWGHFHIPDSLYQDLRQYLRDIGHAYADLHQFGEGPNWRMRTTRAALDALGFRADMLRHGIQREVFMCELATNARAILAGENVEPEIEQLLTIDQVAALALQRWVVPRAQRRPEYQNWRRQDLKGLITPSAAAAEIRLRNTGG